MKKLIFVITLLLFCLSANSQKRRLALVIGNANYTMNILANPVNDAMEMEILLKSSGFQVKRYTDLDQSAMKKAIDEFGSTLNSSEVGLFFYAGHGIQANGRNYLIPVDASLKTENDVEYNCVDAGRILAKMEDAGTKTNIVILDACRDNPFERSWSRKSTGQGLAFMDAPMGSLIAYSTSPGKTASDGSGKNSPYTSAIIQYMKLPNVKIEDFFKLVRVKVRENTNGKQVPWESTSLEGDFYFNLDADYVPADAIVEDIEPGIDDKLKELENIDPASQRMTDYKEHRKNLAASIRSIAILPFANYTGSENNKYIALGLQDALITELGKLGSIRVTARTSTMQYANFQKTINEVASELNVDGIIETSLIGLGENVRFQLKLYSIYPDELMLWSQVYDADMSDILNLYNRVIRNIADEIQLSLTAEQENELKKTIQIDPEAYDAYLKGNYYWEKLDPESVQIAMKSFERAIEIEPEWADPYAGLAETWGQYRMLGLLPASITLPNQLRYLRKALELNPRSARVHYSKALHAVWTEWDWEQGEMEFLKSLELNPNYALARLYYAHLLMILRRTDEAVHQANLGLALDPLSPLVLGLYGVVMTEAGDYQAAISAFEKARTIAPDFRFAFNILHAQYMNGDYEDWIITWEKKVTWNDDAKASVVNTFHEKGHIAAIEEMFKMNDKYGNGIGNANFASSVKAQRYMYLNKPEKALEYLEKTCEEDRLSATYAGAELFFSKLKDNPRYIELLRKMKLPLPDK